MLSASGPDFSATRAASTCRERVFARARAGGARRHDDVSIQTQTLRRGARQAGGAVAVCEYPDVGQRFSWKTFTRNSLKWTRRAAVPARAGQSPGPLGRSLPSARWLSTGGLLKTLCGASAGCSLYVINALSGGQPKPTG
jgi:hypothetical protein